MFEVNWSGSWPCLCHGEWTIKKNGADVSDFIPEDLRHDEMRTKNVYPQWYFDDNWCDQWEYREFGLDENDWIKENEWIKDICDTREEMTELYAAIRENDWVHSSCGGCI